MLDVGCSMFSLPPRPRPRPRISIPNIRRSVSRPAFAGRSPFDVGCSMFDVWRPGFSRVRRSLLRGSQGGTGILPVFIQSWTFNVECSMFCAGEKTFNAQRRTFNFQLSATPRRTCAWRPCADWPRKCESIPLFLPPVVPPARISATEPVESIAASGGIPAAPCGKS